MPDDKSKVQGEGDYESARRFNKRSREFVESNDVEKLGRESRPRSEEEAEDMKEAEEEGKSRAKE